MQKVFLIIICAALFSPEVFYAQHIIFNDKTVVKVFNYENVELFQSSEGKYFAKPMAGHGSGTIIDPEGVILTNAHVVKNARALAVILPGKELVYPAEVIFQKYEPENGIDYALIAIEGYFTDFKPLPDTPNELVQLEDVIAWGYPMDFANKYPAAVKGIISRYDEIGKLWQMDAQINPGNSGGPVINRKGELLGINVSGRRNAEGMNYFMPLDLIIKMYHELKNSSRISDAKRALKEMNIAQKQIKVELLEFLVQSNLPDGLSEESLSKFDKTLSRLSINDTNAVNFEMADYSAIAASVYFNIAQSKIPSKNKYMSNELREEIRGYWKLACEYSELAVKIDPSIKSSQFISILNELSSEFIDPPADYSSSTTTTIDEPRKKYRYNDEFKFWCLEYGTISPPVSPGYNATIAAGDGEFFAASIQNASDDKFGMIFSGAFYYENVPFSSYSYSYYDGFDEHTLDCSTYSLLLELGLHIGSSRANSFSFYCDVSWMMPYLHYESRLAIYEETDYWDNESYINADTEFSFDFLQFNIKNIHIRAGFILYDVMLGVNYRQFVHKIEDQGEYINEILTINFGYKLGR